MKRLRNSAIANKIIKSQQFKEYTRYSLQSCFAKALELEGEFMVGEVVTPRYRQTSIYSSSVLTWNNTWSMSGFYLNALEQQT